MPSPQAVAPIQRTTPEQWRPDLGDDPPVAPFERFRIALLQALDCAASCGPGVTEQAIDQHEWIAAGLVDFVVADWFGATPEDLETTQQEATPQ